MEVRARRNNLIIPTAPLPASTRILSIHRYTRNGFAIFHTKKRVHNNISCFFSPFSIDMIGNVISYFKNVEAAL